MSSSPSISSSSPSAVLLGLACFLLPALFYYLWTSQQLSRRGHGHPLPPGPAGWPLIGNMLEIPHDYPGPTYKKWGDELNSDVISMSAAGQTIVVLNSVDAATDLLDARSGIYSSRPTSTMANDLIGWGYIFSFLPYGEAWKMRRRAFVQHMKPRDLSLVLPPAKEYSNKLLVALAKSPGDKFVKLVQTAMGSFITRLAYGFQITSTTADGDAAEKEDVHLALAKRAMDGIRDVARPGAYLVDSIPALRHVPAWVPGTGFQRKAAAMRVTQREFREVPFAHAVSQIAAGKAQSSFVSVALEALNSSGDSATTSIGNQASSVDRELMKDVAAQFYLAGLDSTANTFITWVWLMMKYPDVQERVHAELDAVLQGGQMPGDEWYDEGRTPFLMATIMEAVRLRPTAPMGGPHLLDKDDVYRGYFIPKGSIVMSNLWAMYRNEEDYPHPEVFNPDRFMTPDGRGLNPAVRDPLSVVFGFGRRICPGAHIARAALWLNAASLASVFAWSEPPANTVDGLGPPPAEPFGVGFQVAVHPFPCELKVRSESARVALASLEEGLGHA